MHKRYRRRRGTNPREAGEWYHISIETATRVIRGKHGAGKNAVQQIREKEQEYAEKTEAIKKETDAAITAVESEAESMLCTADSTGKIEAELLYWQEKGEIEAEIEGLKREAVAVREKVAAAGEKNLASAIETITRSVIME